MQNIDIMSNGTAHSSMSFDYNDYLYFYIFIIEVCSMCKFCVKISCHCYNLY